MNNCFVFRVDGVLRVGLCLFAICYVRGQVGAPGLGGETPRRGVQHRALLCMRASRGAELFYHSPTPAHQTRTLAKAARGAKQYKS